MQPDPRLHPIVQAALTAMELNDRTAFLALFAPDIVLTDDGEAHNFIEWCDSEIFSPPPGRSRAYITAIHHVEPGGLRFTGRLHSEQWGDFDVYNRFQLEGGQIARLEVGQA
jgi:hypothetical protein